MSKSAESDKETEAQEASYLDYAIKNAPQKWPDGWRGIAQNPHLPKDLNNPPVRELVIWLVVHSSLHLVIDLETALAILSHVRTTTNPDTLGKDPLTWPEDAQKGWEEAQKVDGRGTLTPQHLISFLKNTTEEIGGQKPNTKP